MVGSDNSTILSRRTFLGSAGAAIASAAGLGLIASGFDPARVYRDFLASGVEPALSRAEGDRLVFRCVGDESAMDRASRAGLIRNVTGENRSAFVAYLRAQGRVANL